MMRLSHPIRTRFLFDEKTRLLRTPGILLLLSFLLLLRPAAQAQVGNTKLPVNCFRNPTSTYATKNWRKHNSRKHPPVDCTLEPIQRSGVKHCVGKVIPHSNLGGQETSCKLRRSTPWYLKLQFMNYCRSSRLLNSTRGIWKLAEHTVIRFRIIIV